MNTAYNPEVAADKARERYPKTNGQFEAWTLDTAFPESARVFAGKTVAQTRESMTAPRMLSKQQWTLWRNLLTRQARALLR